MLVEEGLLFVAAESYLEAYLVVKACLAEEASFLFHLVPWVFVVEQDSEVLGLTFAWQLIFSFLLSNVSTAPKLKDRFFFRSHIATLN